MAGQLMIALFRDRDLDPDGIANENWLQEAQPVVPVGDGARVHESGCSAYGDAECQRSVGHPLLEILCLAPFRIHVVRKEVARLPGVKHDIRLGGSCAQASRGLR